MSEHELDGLRRKLDEINLQLLQLLNRRATLVQEIGEIKKKQGINKFDPEREQDMLNQLVKQNQGPFDDQTVRYLFKQIFKASLDLQIDEQKKTLLVSRKEQAENTVINLGGTHIGNGTPHVIAGPCSVESEEQVFAVARALKEQGLTLMRGGAFKPRTSPYDFQGLGEEGLKILRRAADEFGLQVISEIVNPADMEMAERYVDVIQIGARNMQNFELLKAAGSVRTPVLLKRGLSATIEEFLFAAEYIVSRGNSQVMLCERGIRTYEKWTRNTLDISAVPILKNESHLPVFVDITHSTGRRDILLPCAKAALAAGADGIMLEVHPNPAVALSDAKQQIDIPSFETFMKDLRASNLLGNGNLVLERR
ncbi:bifunctional 3-deoxy-7-phosphoheptulonate synthase/chorismate mutase [Paenactinomyces guangxiensis]|uniref:Bifunctional 3-deoxy-7-phosphoheptulonate synthase/chorismate mutase n=1 Tax=Paenactinomyces guangxiensis TaxID=1490290 RepID=A0A7W2A7I4_9BACL|nr:bifunctional 3-deoxy-7-phosphoheptulonate synthase/chorismate mutase [Paenactinomyces guangxiensis]MBA4492828.1 bifunctional 3-deoxy-7-phosphoheptulonate synthase/chorismate mutase [Paenactinomyces guangxiensis]MBH8590323.1 bifunctional 3-deoxy-7-phosphoheptulonate synthase/chorismate mutase [Paenactinomyces guangxiensis]